MADRSGDDSEPALVPRQSSACGTWHVASNKSSAGKREAGNRGERKRRTQGAAGKGQIGCLPFPGVMYVALSYDHRVVDGRESVSFLVRLKEYLEDPARLMLEI